MSILCEHHIIPRILEGHRAFRDLDEQVFGVWAPHNLIYLPAGYGLAKEMGVTPHPGGHDARYVDAVRETLDEIAKIEDSGLRATQIRDLIDAMRVGLNNGDLFTNSPLGGTGEEVPRGAARVIRGYAAYRGSNLNQVEALRKVEKTSAEAGYSHLVKWSAILGNASREKLLSEAIRKDPQLNITSGNKDLAGTPWQQKFVAADDNFHVPGSEPADPSHAPQLPGFMPSPLPGSAPEGFTRSDPRLSYGLSGFPAAGPDWQRFRQLPPSTAAPSMPQVLQFNPETGQQMFMSDGSPVLGPNPYEMPDDPRALLGLGIFAGTVAAPALLPTLPAWVWALGALATAGAVAGSSANATPGNHPSGGVFATGAPPYNPFSTGVASNSISNGSPLLGAQSGAQPRTDNAPDQEPARSSTFDDPFVAWPESAAATPQSQPLRKPEEPTAVAVGVAAPEEVRHLTRVSASNAGSVFESGSAPVPYLSSPGFDVPFGNWPGRGSRQASSPVGAFADEPGYAIQPPIWGLDAASNQPNDAEQWFARWIQPLLHQDQR